MKRILLVDDEFYFREALKVSIPWAENGFVICGEAKNGVDALEMIESLKPDIAIVDINMPLMDGLELAQVLSEKGICIKLVILSGHSEFEYARQAVRLGVSNYLLKPVDDQELLQTLLDVKVQIDREASLSVETATLKRQIQQNLPILRDNLLNELLLGQSMIAPDELYHRMQFLDIRLREKMYQVAVIEIDAEDIDSWPYEDRQLWKFAITNIVQEVLPDQFHSAVCYDESERICIIASLGDTEKTATYAELLTERLEQIRDYVQRLVKVFTVTIGIGNIKEALSDIPASYKEARVALRSKLSAGNNQVIPFDAIGEANLQESLLSSAMRNQFLMNLRTLSMEETTALITQAFEKIRSGGVHHELVMVFCVELASICLEIISEMGLTMKDVFRGAPLSILEQIQSMRTIHEMETWIQGFYRVTFDTLGKKKGTKASKLMQEVKQYIAENYGDDQLNINHMAKHLFINYSHLCFVFKRETGVTINEYIMEYRIAKAKTLFDQGNHSVSDVALRVGYADANYFGKSFKKTVGLAPSKYVESLALKQ